MRIDARRLHRDLEELGKIGCVEGRGVTRLALSEDDLRGRQWLMDRMQVAGLEVRVDAAANVIGRLPAAGEGAQTLIIGSHLDTVPQGGMFDGALGVLAGLECA
ncbi:MAG: M28 family peptidase, partial [Bacillota bacterium]